MLYVHPDFDCSHNCHECTFQPEHSSQYSPPKSLHKCSNVLFVVSQIFSAADVGPCILAGRTGYLGPLSPDLGTALLFRRFGDASMFRVCRRCRPSLLLRLYPMTARRPCIIPNRSLSVALLKSASSLTAN